MKIHLPYYLLVLLFLALRTRLVCYYEFVGFIVVVVFQHAKREWESPCIGISIYTSFRVNEGLLLLGLFLILPSVPIPIVRNSLETLWKSGILIIFLWILLKSMRWSWFLIFLMIVIISWSKHNSLASINNVIAIVILF